MPLSVGTRLGQYEIIAALGAGGMGEVYRARDSRLDREVAIKVLPEALAQNPERLARFEREAKVLASLNHPNIAQIYGIEERALVIELIPGETLKGPLPLNTALDYARQIADGLKAAHEKGITHRDLKPANIMITPEGKVKLLDFGLAAVPQRAAAAGSDAANSPTLTMSPTQAGMILGTAAYMSPEQARGKAVDQRADIWAFGCVLCEMITGHAPFEGETVTDILAAVLKHEPDLREIPAEVRPLIERCLEKDPKLRLQDIGDAWLLVGVGLTNAGSRRGVVPWLFVCALLVLLSAVSFSHFAEKPPVAASSLTLSIIPPKDKPLVFAGTLNSAPQISPDGSAVLYYPRGDGYYVRRLDALEPKHVPGSEQASNEAFWAADSLTVLYPKRGQPGQVWVKVRMPDGPAEVFSQQPLSYSRGGNWGDRGTVLISSGMRLFALSAENGRADPLDVPGLQTGSYEYPEFLPGGSDFLFLFWPQHSEENEVYLATLRNGKVTDPVLLLKNDTAARYTPANGGRILFVRNDNLYSRKLDLKRRRLDGESQLVVEGIAAGPGSSGEADFSVSRTGVIAFRTGRAALSQVTVLDRRGTILGTAGPPSPANFVVLSPDEKRLIINAENASWLLDVSQTGRLGLGAGSRWLWSPDASRLIGQSLPSPGRIAERSASASGEVRELGDSPGLIMDISTDGSQALYNSGNTKSGLIVARLDGTPAQRAPITVVDTGETIGGGVFSPDGHWIAYCVLSDRMTTVLYVQPFPGPGLRRQIAPACNFVQWRKDGKEIVYDDKADLYSVRVETAGGELAFTAPQKLFSGPGPPPPGLNTGSRLFAVSRDGSRIYWLRGTAQPDSDVIHIKTGWAR
jgi:serine/threonine protein kinase